jgi:putative transposase
VLSLVGIAQSTYYKIMKRKKSPPEACDDRVSRGGRPIPGYSFAVDGKKVCDEEIKEFIYEAIEGDGYAYGYKKLTAELRDVRSLVINQKKVYRLCKEMNILAPQREVKKKHPRRLARRETVTGPNQQWQMDIKYGCIHATGRFFYQLSVIDVFDRTIVAWYLGLSCKADDACQVLQQALDNRGICVGQSMPKVRTDNGPQFVANAFEELCEARGIVHQRIPPNTPNMNAFIEAFHSILESECYSRHEWTSFEDVYETVYEFMVFYDERRRHGSLGYRAPKVFRELLVSNSIEVLPLVA